MSLLLPLVTEASPDTAKAVTDAFAATRAAIASHAGAATYADVSADARKALAASFNALADAIDRINPALGLE